MQLVTTVLKFVPLAVIGIVGLFFIDGGNYEPFNPHGASLGLLSTTAALTLWAFIGLESATVPAEEVKDPERTIPRATILGTVLATVLYIVATVRDHGHHPDRPAGRSSSRSPTPPARLRRRLGQGDRRWCAGLDLRRPQRLDPDPGPRADGGRRGRHVPGAVRARSTASARTPVFGLVVSSILVTALMLMNYTKGLVDAFTFVILLATLTTLVPYAFSAAAQAWLWLVERESSTQAPRARRRHRHPRLRLQRVGDRRRRATTSSPRASCSCCPASPSTSACAGGRSATRL